MAGVNKVILIGNLGRDPELRVTQGGAPVATLSVATTRVWFNKANEKQEETEWHRVVVWGKTAEHCDKFLSKGRSVYVEGRLKTRSYDDKDGVKKYSTEIVADVVQFLGGRGEEGQRGDRGDDGGSRPEGRRSGGGSGGPPEPYDPGDFNQGGGGGPEDDIPF